METKRVPTRDEMIAMADEGMTFPRIAGRYGRGIKLIKNLAKLWPDIEAKIVANGKVRTADQKVFGDHRVRVG